VVNYLLRICKTVLQFTVHLMSNNLLMRQLISTVMYNSQHLLLVNTLWKVDPVNLVILPYYITFFSNCIVQCCC